MAEAIEDPDEARKRAEREEGHRLAREKELRELRWQRISWGKLAETGFWSTGWVWVVIPSPFVLLYLIAILVAD